MPSDKFGNYWNILTDFNLFVILKYLKFKTMTYHKEQKQSLTVQCVTIRWRAQVYTKLSKEQQKQEANSVIKHIAVSYGVAQSWMQYI